MMFYRLTDHYMLRGYKGAPAVLVNRRDHVVEALSAGEFRILMLCDGTVDFSALSLSGKEKKILESLLAEKVVEAAVLPEEIGEEQKYYLYDNRYVGSCFWSVTGRCNYRCRHCYVDAPDALLGEISSGEAFSFIDQMAECGVFSVDLTGGEPLLRKDFQEICRHLAEKKIRIGTLYTNGALLDERVLEGFLSRGQKPQISISFDGAGYHDWMRRSDGAEEKALRALKLCQQYGFATDVQMCIHKKNKDSLRETVNLLKDYGVTALKAADVTQTPLWEKNAEGSEMSVREYFETAIGYIPYFYQDHMPMDVTLSGVACLYGHSFDYEVVPDAYPEGDAPGDCYLCASARQNTYIAPDGRLLPCMPMAAYAEQSCFPKIQETGLKSALSESFYMHFVDSRLDDLIRANKECRECRFLYRCKGGCRANALSLHGAAGEENVESRLMGRDPYQCILFKEGYVDRIYRVIREAVEAYGKAGD